MSLLSATQTRMHGIAVHLEVSPLFVPSFGQLLSLSQVLWFDQTCLVCLFSARRTDAESWISMLCLQKLLSTHLDLQLDEKYFGVVEPGVFQGNLSMAIIDTDRQV